MGQTAKKIADNDRGKFSDELRNSFLPEQKSLQKKDVKEDVKEAPARDDCPWDKDTLGKSTWGLLHTMAAHYPDEPNQEQQKDMKGFFSILSRLYPCEFCAKDFRSE